MAEHKALKKALRQMKEGSRSAFHTFYLGSSQYIYSSALLLYDSHEDACRFMVDFYQYLYLHLPEYDRSGNLENWISRLLIERFEQLSIGKNMPKPTVEQQMNFTTAKLSKSEQERIWRMLDVNIRFPKEPVHRSSLRIVLLVSSLLLLLLIAIRYLPSATKWLRNASGQENNIENENNASDPDRDTQADEPDSTKDELDDLLNERANADKDSTPDNTDALQVQQQTKDNTDSDQTKTPESPSEPDTPQEPEQPQSPQEPQTPSISDGSNTLSGTDELENLELELRYGDSLRF